jgi:hypothetical protein
MVQTPEGGVDPDTGSQGWAAKAEALKYSTPLIN